MKYPSSLQQLIESLKKLPGVGSRSAERFAFKILEWPPDQTEHLASLLQALPRQVRHCSECGCLAEEGRCFFCHHPHRDTTSICVLASPRDVYAIEETGQFRGMYHVLKGLLSPMDGRGPGALNLPSLFSRIERFGVQEVILALDSSLEGDATALYLGDQLAEKGIRASRLAFGLPMGSSLDYVDGGTLARALSGRQLVESSSPTK